MPMPIACKVVCCRKVDMTIAQFGQHLTAHLKELVAIHLVADAHTIFFVHLVPIESIRSPLLFKETVVLVEYLP